MCKNYSTFDLFNVYCSSLLFHFYLLLFFSVINLCSFFFLYIKRAYRLMNSVMNSIFCLVTYLFSLFFFFFFFSPTWFELVFFFERIFICLLFTCSVSLHCIHTKSNKYYIHLQKKNVQILQMCTTFTNFYVFTILIYIVSDDARKSTASYTVNTCSQ